MDLFSKSNKDYGPEYRTHLFEQYKIYIESTEKISDRRQQTNHYFIAINAALISLMGLSFWQDIIWIKVVLSLVGILTCVVFHFLIKSYRQINTGKFALIHEIEESLPLRLYAYEWKEKLAEGKNREVYYPFSHVENWIQWIFGITYAALIVFFLNAHIGIHIF